MHDQSERTKDSTPLALLYEQWRTHQGGDSGLEEKFATALRTFLLSKARILLSGNGSRLEPEDAVQNTIVKILKGKPEIRDNALGFFTRVLSNIIHDAFRGKRREEPLLDQATEQPSRESSPSHRLKNEEDGRLVDGYLAEYWTDSERDSFVRWQLGEASLESLAQQHGYTETALRTKLWRAQKRFLEAEATE